METNVNLKKPKYLVTYICSKCGLDFARTELDKPECFYCNNQTNQVIITKQKLTPKVMAERLKTINDRMMQNLKKAYQTKPDDADEEELLQIMSNADSLRKSITSMKLEKRNKN